MRAQTAFFLVLLTAAAHAGPRTSASYTVATDTADAGGKRATSAAYTNDGSAGGIVGVSTVAAPARTVKHGYLGQLYELAPGVFLAPEPPVAINEGGTLQIIAARNLDDGTGLALDPTTVAWSVLGGPVSISTSGLVTAGLVYQNTAASLQGIVESTTLPLPLTVLNVNIDNFGAYASDGIDDAWQVQYFGQPPNADAGPNVDVSGTGQTNFFKYIAGLNPLDPNSRFTLQITPVPGEAGHKNITFAPRFTDRTYTVTSKPSLTAGSYVPLTNPSAPSDNGTQRTITDRSATGAEKFYRVEITKP